jgi:hypothetical protein
MEAVGSVKREKKPEKEKEVVYSVRIDRTIRPSIL